MNITRSHVVGDATAVLVLKVLHAALLFVVSAIVSRGLGPEGRGLYYTPLLVATTTIALCHLGLDQANVYLFASRKVPINKLIGQSGTVAVFSGVIGGGVVAVLGLLDLRLFAGIPYWMTATAAILVPFGVHAILSTGLLIVQGRIATPLLVSIAITFAQLIALGVLAASGLFTPEWVFATAAAAALVTALALSTVLAPTRELVSWDSVLLRESLAHSLVLHVGMALLFLHLRVDMYLVKWSLGTAALGVYSLAVVLAETLMLVADSLGTVLTPRQVKGSIQEGARTALAGVRCLAILGIPLLLVWSLFGPAAIDVAFGSSFRQVYIPLLILLPGIVLLGMQRVCGPTVLRAGRPWLLTSFQAAGFLLNLLLNLWWIRVWGLAGAAAASTLSYAVIATAFLFWTTRIGGQPLTAIVPGKNDLRQLFDATVVFRRGRIATSSERQNV